MFADEYIKLEDQFREQAKEDGNVFLPNIPPKDKVDFILIGMEPSLRRWAKNKREAKNKIRKLRFKNFLYSMEDFILHFCVREYLCKNKYTYYITDISKGAMTTKEARRNPKKRYLEWYDMLLKELCLVAKPKSKILAIGKKVGHFLKKQGCKELSDTLPHYSNQASGYRNKYVQARQREFEKFAPTVRYNDIIKVAKTVMKEANYHTDLIDETLARFPESKFSTSKKKLIFIYKDIMTKIKALNCSICGSKLDDPELARHYSNFVCRNCGEKAVNQNGQRPYFKSAHDDGDNPIFIDGIKCWRRYRFGGYITMRDDYDCANIMEFYEKTNSLDNL